MPYVLENIHANMLHLLEIGKLVAWVLFLVMTTRFAKTTTAMVLKFIVKHYVHGIFTLLI